jgi:hypothetical protein
MIPEAIEMIADRVLSLEDSDLHDLLEHYKSRMAGDEPDRSWERAVIAYFLINGLRMKDALKRCKMQRHCYPEISRLRLVKA